MTAPCPTRSLLWTRGLVLSGALLSACQFGDPDEGKLSGQVEIDGSSTVFPVQQVLAEDFEALHPDVQMSVGFQGTVTGFSRLCRGEIDLQDASRAIYEAEVTECARNGVTLTRFPVAWDGVSVVVNPRNEFVECISIDELRRIWEPGSTIRTWREIRADFPDEAIDLYGPGRESGTFDYFTEAVIGTPGASRTDYRASEDDNMLVEGIAGDEHALGYFGYAYVVENQDRLKLVAVDGGGGCVMPSELTIGDGTYAPLARPLFVYVRRESLARPEVSAYVEFMLTNAASAAAATGYHPLSEAEYGENLAELEVVVDLVQ